MFPFPIIHFSYFLILLRNVTSRLKAMFLKLLSVNLLLSKFYSIEILKVKVYDVCFVAELTAVILVLSILLGRILFSIYSFKTKIDLSNC